jgi:glycosyltransferase involved in cell wall biosynthesis
MNPTAGAKAGSADGWQSNGQHAASALDAERPILQVYLAPEGPFIDRFEQDRARAVDVVIPVLHTNDLWKKNLLSIYREVPVNRLLLGDGGCIDKTLEIAAEFPRLFVFDHRKHLSLGYSLRQLIEEVKTDWFLYLHSDVFLPAGWFDKMETYQDKYDWYECRQHLTVLLDYPLPLSKSRAYSGSQMGRTSAFRNVLPFIEDDFLYRNEDIIISELVQQQGYRYGRVDEVCHYHQQMPKKSIWERRVRVHFAVECSPEEETRVYTMQAKGLVKYLQPSVEFALQVRQCVDDLVAIGATTWPDFERWVSATNPKWTPYLSSAVQASLQWRLKSVLRDARVVTKSFYQLGRSLLLMTLCCFRWLSPLRPSRVK